MKLSLTLLVIFGLVAFIGAAPAEEEPEIPEEFKEDLPADEQDEALEVPQDVDEDEDIRDSFLQRIQMDPHKVRKPICRARSCAKGWHLVHKDSKKICCYGWKLSGKRCHPRRWHRSRKYNCSFWAKYCQRRYKYVVYCVRRVH
ncbi:uncharacterized protein LOC110253928 [Exaiptasia diaphana]|uniref:Uncharacterized protein n=1 Tax=Exaiptasia diaphana TaxID=2652724 RepID=A0A913Y7W4_EXADI|nr:uncharacterized protein LOC110253928 [Exaiptasia diaphana]KXJ21611.1 hypothetical protein AC249_AIPGENE18045 [Exaiptasia diaphana]